ncbi:hypothetical protein C8F01DRAFT_1083949 [Mycena amicta]|nr:hypothetical protein C8F01DRAFT_1083949 [Mycena amicta]
MGSRSVLFLPPNFGDLGDIGRDYLWSPPFQPILLARLSPLVVRQPAIVLRSDGRGLDLRQGQAQAVEEIHPDMPTDAIVHGPRHSSQFPRSYGLPSSFANPLSFSAATVAVSVSAQAKLKRSAKPVPVRTRKPRRLEGPTKSPAMMATTASWRRNLFPTPSATVSSADVGDGQVADSTTRRRDPPQTSDRPSRSASPLANFPPPQRPGATTPAPTVAPGAFSAEQLPEWNSMLTRQTDCLRAKMELKAVMNDIVQSSRRSLPLGQDRLGSPALETRRPSFQERLGAGQRRSLSPSDVAREDGPQRKKAKHHLVQQTENGKGQEGRKRKTRRGKPNAHNLARAYARKVAKDNIFSERRLTGPITTAAAGSSSINASHQTTSTTAAGFSVANACQARAQMSDDEVSLGEDYGE